MFNSLILIPEQPHLDRQGFILGLEDGHLLALVLVLDAHLLLHLVNIFLELIYRQAPLCLRSFRVLYFATHCLFFLPEKGERCSQRLHLALEAVWGCFCTSCLLSSLGLVEIALVL